MRYCDSCIMQCVIVTVECTQLHSIIVTLACAVFSALLLHLPALVVREDAVG